MAEVISVQNLNITFPGKEAVRGASFDLRPGELLALVGESGSGKSVLCRSLLGLPPKGAKVTYEAMECPAPHEMSLIMQDAMTALDPAMPVGKQIAEANRKDPPDAIALLERVGIGEARLRARQYPGEFSGGMRQRAAAAVALAMRPRVIFADEPTTSLDAGTRHTMMELLSRLRREDDTAILFVTHDLGLVRDYADRVLIMREGRIIERGETAAIFADPQEEYTKELLRYAALGDPANHTHRSGGARGGNAPAPLVEAKGLSKFYPLGGGRIQRVFANLDIRIYPGEIAGLSGPSGCGKSTLARILAGLEKPSGGERAARAGIDIQMIFQDSASALNPRMTVEKLIAEPLLLREKKRPARERILRLMQDAELEPELLSRRPRELSGGQRQRVAIARAIATRPDLIIADEPVSSLDAATCSRVIHLLRKLKDEYGLTMLLISHDLNLLAHVSDRVVEMAQAK